MKILNELGQFEPTMPSSLLYWRIESGSIQMGFNSGMVTYQPAGGEISAVTLFDSTSTPETCELVTNFPTACFWPGGSVAPRNSGTNNMAADLAAMQNAIIPWFGRGERPGAVVLLCNGSTMVFSQAEVYNNGGIIFLEALRNLANGTK